jgi:hypothetical protein
MIGQVSANKAPTFCPESTARVKRVLRGLNVMLTSPSSTSVVSFPAADKPPFAAAAKAWLRITTAHRRLTAGEARLCSALYQHFNFEHYEKTGELIAWPSWKTLMAWSALSKTTIFNAIVKLERLRLLEVEHGRFDGATRKRAGNVYHVPPRFGVVNPAPDQGSKPRFTLVNKTLRIDSVIQTR